MLGGSWGYGPAGIPLWPLKNMGYRGVPAPDRKVVGRHDTLADKSLMRREAQERVRRLGEIWTGPATEVTFAWAHMIGSMRARRSRERPRNEGGPQLMGEGEGIGGKGKVGIRDSFPTFPFPYYIEFLTPRDHESYGAKILFSFLQSLKV